MVWEKTTFFGPFKKSEMYLKIKTWKMYPQKVGFGVKIVLSDMGIIKSGMS